jgi:NTP pyrophosphatase (non-canonical NTP hydrolase)
MFKNIEDFRIASKRTLSNKPQTELDDNELMITNMLLGLSGELHEIYIMYITKNIDKLKDEIGDLCWYIVCLSTKINNPLDKFITYDYRYIISTFDKIGIYNYQMKKSDTLFIFISFLISQISEKFKKVIYHRHKFDTIGIKELIDMLISCIILFCEINKIDFNLVLNYNYGKLLKRYKQGFNIEESINREN